LALANLSSIERRPDLYRHFNAIDHPEIIKLCELLNIRTTRLNDNSPYDKDFLIEVLIGRFEKRTSQIDAINAMPLYPDEV